MKRLMRIIINGLAVLSLLLCAAMVVLWIGSELRRASATRLRLIRLDEGDVYLILSPGHVDEWIYTPWDRKSYPSAEHAVWKLTAILGLSALAVIQLYLDKQLHYALEC
jgi:hypothetical protein